MYKNLLIREKQAIMLDICHVLFNDINNFVFKVNFVLGSRVELIASSALKLAYGIQEIVFAIFIWTII